MSEADSESDMKRSIGLRLHVLARMMRARFDREVGDLNITRSQWAMIAVVARRPGSTQRTIAEALEMSEASAGRLVDRLCADGLLQRVERDDDRRARAVYVTQAAEPLLAKLAEVARTSEEHIFRGFSETELDQFNGFIDRVFKNLG